MAFMRPRVYALPDIAQPFPESQDLTTDAYWIPYPDVTPRIETNLGKLMSIQYKLSELGAEISNFVFENKNENDPKHETFGKIEADLQALSRFLPQYDRERVICPHTMDLQ